MASSYRWLFDDLKKKFRQSWAMTRSFDFVAHKRIHQVSTTTKQEEVGAWKSLLQLSTTFWRSWCYWGRETSEELRKQLREVRGSYCSKFSFSKFQVSNQRLFVQPFIPKLHQEAFVKWNSWTEAHNYLLVEKLVTKSEEESWKDLALMVDSSATFETESMKCQAARKYAAYYKIPVEQVQMEEVAKSPGGLRGWCEMQITVKLMSNQLCWCFHSLFIKLQPSAHLQ